MAGLLDLLYPQAGQAGQAASPGFNMGLVNAGLGLMRPQGPGAQQPFGSAALAALNRQPQQKQGCQCPQMPDMQPQGPSNGNAQDALNSILQRQRGYGSIY